MPETPQLNLTDKEIENLIRRIHDGDIDEFNLPIEYYYHVCFLLKQALYKGMEIKDITDLSKSNLRLVEELQGNIYHFSSAKTFAQTLEMSNAVTKGEEVVPWHEFKQIAADIYSKYNGGKFLQDEEKMGYLQTEYDQIIADGQTCVNWSRIEDQKTTLPYLRKNVVEDDNTCEICEPLDGMTAPVDDLCWNELAGSLHFKCRCFEEQLDMEDGKAAHDPHIVESKTESQTKLMDPMFKQNVYKTREIFNKDTPAFDVPEKYMEIAKQNFGLKLPKE